MDEQRHATDESGDCAHWCRACTENIKAGLNPDGTERVCHCGDGFDDHRAHTHTHSFVEYNASSLECPRITQAVERAIAAERAAIRAEIESMRGRYVESHGQSARAAAFSLLRVSEWLEARSKGGAK